jgi:hypothetical protein
MGEEISPSSAKVSTASHNRYNRTSGECARSSGVYDIVWGAVAWVLFGEHPILRAAYWVAITVALWLNRLGLACVLLALGQLRICLCLSRRQ